MPSPIIDFKKELKHPQTIYKNAIITLDDSGRRYDVTSIKEIQFKDADTIVVYGRCRENTLFKWVKAINEMR